MLATTVDFLKESDQVFLVMTGPLTDAINGVQKPCSQGLANANIVFALSLRLNHFPRKSHSLRRIYAWECSPFLLETSHLSVGTGNRKKLICALKPRYGALHTRFDDHAPRNENYRGFIDHN
jgi:hypothetical protein